MHKYTTVSGDTWDDIAYREMGSEDFMYLLMEANPAHRAVYIFSAGTELVIPDAAPEAAAGLPPWKRGVT